jgi:glycosyltransferase involved in cell wall biosynthesis
LAVVGSGENAGPEDQTGRLRTLRDELGLGDAVHFVGSVGDDELLNYYAAADVFVLPSSSEAQGIVALEAMASGLPVVATAVGGLLGTIEDGETGFLVPSAEVEPLVERLVQVLREGKLRARIKAEARAVVEREFSWSVSVAATLDVYRELSDVAVQALEC